MGNTMNGLPPSHRYEEITKMPKRIHPSLTSTFKIDVDVKMREKLLNIFLETRLKMLENLGYVVIGHTWKETDKGFHFWFQILGELIDEEMAVVQFLLGDDQVRCRFNFLRDEAGAFKQFNALFNKKLKKKVKA